MSYDDDMRPFTTPKKRQTGFEGVDEAIKELGDELTLNQKFWEERRLRGELRVLKYNELYGRKKLF